MLAFLRAVGRLKPLPRQGWVDRGIPRPESVADHSFRATVMAWILGRMAGLDADHLVKLMLVHDLPEAEVGDATPYGHLVLSGLDLEEALHRWRDVGGPDQSAAARREKRRLEAAGLARLCASLPPPYRAELGGLWREYSERRTPEARFAAQIDKLEALLQAIEYGEAGYDADVASFLQSAREAVEHPVLVALLADLEAAAEPCCGNHN